MITNPSQLKVAMDQLSELEDMLETMRRDCLANSPSLFPTVSEGYLRRTRDLQADIFQYLRIHVLNGDGHSNVQRRPSAELEPQALR